MSKFSRTYYNKLLLNFKALTKISAFLYSTIFCIFLAGIIVVVFMPFVTMGGVQISFVVNIPLMIILGGLSYNWKQSSLSKNEKGFGDNKIVNHLSNLSFVFIIGALLFFLLNMCNIILAQSDLLLDGFVWDDNVNLTQLMWDRINWANYFYSFIINILVTYSVFFIVYRLIRDQKNYYIFVVIMLILFLIFGASVNGFFGAEVEPNTNLDGNVVPEFNNTPFARIMFIPSLFFPFYGAAQYYQTTVQLLLGNHGHPGLSMSIENDFVFKIFTGESWRWTLTFLQPWIVIMTSFTVGTLISSTTNNI